MKLAKFFVGLILYPILWVTALCALPFMLFPVERVRFIAGMHVAWVSISTRNLLRK